MKALTILFLITVISACASAPKFDTSKVDLKLTPKAVVNDAANSKHKSVLWGGIIINIKNLKQYTQLEILAYPLNSFQQPSRSKKPLGRFLIRHDGFLEPSDYDQGRAITVLGTINKLQSGRVGESDYLYPQLSSQQLHLWPKDLGESRTRFHFGIGIGL